MVVSEVMDLTKACQNFPGPVAQEIQRANLLETIDIMFEGDAQLIAVEGPQGIGKTQLLKQFGLRHPDHSLSIFIDPYSRLTSDPDILRLDLCNQLNWALDGCDVYSGPRDLDSEGGLKT